MQGSLRERWQRLTRRERRLVFAAASVVAAGLAYALLWLPLLQATARGEAELPQLRRQAERLRAHLDAQGKAASGKTSLSKPSVVELRAIAARAGIPAATVQAEMVDGTSLRVRVDGVAGDPLMDLLEAAQRDKGWRVSELQVVRLAEPGRVRAEFVLVGA
jgi:type II secretory pathway component PulM